MIDERILNEGTNERILLNRTEHWGKSIVIHACFCGFVIFSLLSVEYLLCLVFCVALFSPFFFCVCLVSLHFTSNWQLFGLVWFLDPTNYTTSNFDRTGICVFVMKFFHLSIMFLCFILFDV